MAIQTSDELRAALNMVLARLNDGLHTYAHAKCHRENCR
jgi:hypothetical protein